MADIIDEANDRAAFFLAQSLRLTQQAAKKTAPTGIGMCLCCGAYVEPPRRWCDKECADLWQQDQRRG